MKLARVLLAAVAVVATLVAVADAAAARSIRAAGPVRALSVTGYEVAYAHEYRTGCFELRVWSTLDGGDRRYASHCFVSTSTGSGIAQLAVARGRLLWISYTGGNFREYSLWTKSRTSKPRKIAFVTREVDDPAPVVVGTADADALPYALGRTVVVLAPSGARRFSWQAPAEVRSLSAQGARYTAVLADGAVWSLDARGTARLEAQREPRELVAASWGATGLLLHTRGAVETGGESFAVSRTARRHGYAGGLYAYSANRELRLLRVVDGRDTRAAAVGEPALAGLDRRGYAWANGRTITFRAL